MNPNTWFKDRVAFLCGLFLVLSLAFPGMAQITTNNPLALPALRTNTPRPLMFDPPVLRLRSGVTTQATAQVEPTPASAFGERFKSLTTKPYEVRLGYDCSTSGFG